MEWINNPHTWVNLGLLIFVIFAGPKVWRGLAGFLDQRSMKIKADLDEAQKLRDEAQALLAEYQRKQRDAVKEAEDIVASAKGQAQREITEAAANLVASLSRREAAALEKIAQAEAQAVAEVRREAVDVAAAATSRLIARTLDDAKASALIDQSIAEVNRRLH
ncbi:MAG TPA: F0F1 ATP synthase subunit B [Terriglobia bacterium]|nr:F0F1 ATP synthase subunit B [Terriglobia bacterium]